MPEPDEQTNRLESLLLTLVLAGLCRTLLPMHIVIIVFLLFATRFIACAATVDRRFLGVLILTLSPISPPRCPSPPFADEAEAVRPTTALPPGAGPRTCCARGGWCGPSAPMWSMSTPAAGPTHRAPGLRPAIRQWA